MGREVLEMGGERRMSGKRESKDVPEGLRLGSAGMQGSRLHAGALRPSGQDAGAGQGAVKMEGS